MSDPAIRVQDLSKHYYLGQLEPYKTLRDSLTRAGRRVFRRFAEPERRLDKKSFWALRDVTFDVLQGEVIGIIGRNGAGKSTLLKILSRITDPTKGQVELRGRVGSLLEVGTGFHPELTGRENIYLNGAILGMSRVEISSTFDEIVAFSGVDRFLDTPVKRYSSGMYVRLAFAVAAHLSPEILIVDEVLAVGDSDFQRKCLGKMGAVAKDGRTVLFVSHNMAAVGALCSTALVLKDGTVDFIGETEEAVAHYSRHRGEGAAVLNLALHEDRRGTGQTVLKTLVLRDNRGCQRSVVQLGSALTFEFELESTERLGGCHLNVRVMDWRGVRLLTLFTKYQAKQELVVDGSTRVTCRMDNCRLMPGVYQFAVVLTSNGDVVDAVESGLGFEITAADVYGTGKTLPPHTGAIAPEVEWTFAHKCGPIAACGGTDVADKR